MTSRRFGVAIAAGVLNSRISAPPENALPAPARTIALTLASASAFSSPSAIPLRTPWASVLTGGFSRVMTATSPWTAYPAVLMGVLYCGETILSPTIPATISPMQPSRIAVAGSANRMIPRIAVPAAPTPVHTA